MATISNTSRPGYVWDTTDNVWYPIGTGVHTHDYVASTLIDAKGDLIVGSAADTAARLAVGTNNQILTADSAATNGVKWATPTSTVSAVNSLVGSLLRPRRGSSRNSASLMFFLAHSSP